MPPEHGGPDLTAHQLKLHHYPTRSVVVDQVDAGADWDQTQCEPVLSPAARRRQGTSPLPRVLGADSERGPPLQYEDTIEIRGVTVMRQTDVALLCRMGNQHRWIAPTQLQPGSTVAHSGDVGTIVLKRPFAVEQGLVPFQGLHD